MGGVGRTCRASQDTTPPSHPTRLTVLAPNSMPDRGDTVAQAQGHTAG